jgi:hypothetical protein
LNDDEVRADAGHPGRVRKQDATKYRRQLDRFDGLVARRRLRDIGALPFDLLV